MSVGRWMVGAALLVLSERVAHAYDKNACADAYESTQRERAAGRLERARAHALVCGDATCSEVLSPDCVRWASEIDALQPSIVLSVVDSEGRDVVEAEVQINEVIVARRLDGRELRLDPGQHRVVVTANGQRMQSDILAEEGQRRKRIQFTLPTDGTSRSIVGVDGEPEPLSWVPLAIVGLGAAGILTFAILGGTASADEACAPYCSIDEADSIRARMIGADVALGAGGLALLGGGIWLTVEIATNEPSAKLAATIPVD
jgi:hypothetical protein